MSQFAWTFPGGKPTIQKDTAKAGNTAQTITVPAGKVWLILNIMIKLVTDATVVNRFCTATLRDSADVSKFENVASAIAASTTASRFFSKGVSAINSTVNSLGFGLLGAGEDIYLWISSGVAGDSYDYLIEYLEIDAP